MSWTRLESAADWDAYKPRTAAALGVDAGTVQWGQGPAEYPCLVASTLTRQNGRPDGLRVASCYVYAGDARRLVGQEGGGAAGQQSVVGEPAAPRGSDSDDTEFRRYLVAHVLTLVDELRRVGITKADRYEKIFNGFLAGVDQATVSRAADVSPKSIFARTERTEHE